MISDRGLYVQGKPQPALFLLLIYFGLDLILNLG